MQRIHVKQKFFLLQPLLSLTVVLLALGCHSQARAEQGVASSDGVTICIGGAPGIPPLLTYENGFFPSVGLKVGLKKFRTATEGFEGFFKGECDLSAVSETSVVMKSFDRQDFSIVATYATSDNSPRILASRKSGISTPQDLKGKRIFVLKWNSNHFFLDMFLAKNGLSERDVSMIFAGVPDVSAAFASGSIDAFCATEVLIDKAKKALGDGAVVFDSPGLCLVSFHLAVKNTFIKARPEILTKVLAALLKNEANIAAEQARASKMAAAALGIEEKVMQEIWGHYRWQVGLSQAMLLSLEQEAQWAIDSGFTTKTRIPNYLNYIHRDALFALKPQAVTMLK